MEESGQLYYFVEEQQEVWSKQKEQLLQELEATKFLNEEEPNEMEELKMLANGKMNIFELYQEEVAKLFEKEQELLQEYHKKEAVLFQKEMDLLQERRELTKELRIKESKIRQDYEQEYHKKEAILFTKERNLLQEEELKIKESKIRQNYEQEYSEKEARLFKREKDLFQERGKLMEKLKTTEDMLFTQREKYNKLNTTYLKLLQSFENQKRIIANLLDKIQEKLLSNRTDDFSIIATALKQHNIQLSSNTISQIQKYPSQMTFAASTYLETKEIQYILNFVNTVKQLPNTADKRNLGKANSIAVNGAIDSQGFLLSAIDFTNNMPILVKTVPPNGNEINLARFFNSVKETIPEAICLIHELQNAMPDECKAFICMKRMIGSIDQLPTCTESHLLMQGHRIKNALAFLHSHNLIHMDVKNTNILFDMNGDWYLTDFGACISKDSIIYQYSPLYFPNNIAGRRATPEYDYFALGVTLVIEIVKDDYKQLLFENRRLSLDKLYSIVQSHVKNKNLQQFIEELLHHWVSISES